MIFFVWRDALPSMAAANYFSLLQQVTVGSDLTLPVPLLSLLGGMIGITGILTFACTGAALSSELARWRDSQLHPHQANERQPDEGLLSCGGATRSRTGLNGFAIRCITALLSRRKSCVPFRHPWRRNHHHSGKKGSTRASLFLCLEREKSLELSTSTLARLRSTN